MQTPIEVANKYQKFKMFSNIHVEVTSTFCPTLYKQMWKFRTFLTPHEEAIFHFKDNSLILRELTSQLLQYLSLPEIDDTENGPIFNPRTLSGSRGDK